VNPPPACPAIERFGRCELRPGHVGSHQVVTGVGVILWGEWEWSPPVDKPST
jgi:hypothetical protein